MKKWLILFVSLACCLVIKAQIPVMPEFPGGKDSLNAFLARNIHWPKDDKCPEGKVVVTFTVESSGVISNIKVPEPFCKPIDKEVMRVVSMMPKWIPGKIGGMYSSFTYALPISTPKK